MYVKEQQVNLALFLLQQPLHSVNLRPMYVTAGENVLLKTFLLIPFYALAAYVFINTIMAWAIKNEWKKITAGVLLLAGLMFTIGYVMYWEVFPLVDAACGPT